MRNATNVKLFPICSIRCGINFYPGNYIPMSWKSTIQLNVGIRKIWESILYVQRSSCSLGNNKIFSHLQTKYKDSLISKRQNSFNQIVIYIFYSLTNLLYRTFISRKFDQCLVKFNFAEYSISLCSLQMWR